MKNKITPLLLKFFLISIATMVLYSCNGEFSLPPTAESNLIATASENPELTTFLLAIKRAGLTDTLTSHGPFTIFAPTNAAFAAQLNFDQITTDSLEQIMRYHIVSGRYLTAFFRNDSIQTLFDNNFIRIRVADGQVNLNVKANITTGNIEAINGMIHIIDQVLTRE